MAGEEVDRRRVSRIASPLGIPLRALADLTLPPTCAACGAPDASLCDDCQLTIPGCLWVDGPRWVAPDPAPAGIPPVASSARYEGPVARLVSAYKDDGRRDCASVLGELLSAAVQAAVGAIVSDALAEPPRAGASPADRLWPVLVVPVPSSAAARRRRGDSPLVALVRRACRGFARSEVRPLGALHHRRRLADQAGLDAAGRAANLEQSMGVRSRWSPVVAGSRCVLVDDVMTTGATLAEAARAMREAGARDVRAATICATQRRSPGPLSQ